MKHISAIIGILFCSLVFGQNTQENLLLHYKFDSNYLDNSGNGYDGENFGAVFVEDRFGRQDSAVYFNGINSYILFPNVQELKPLLPVSFSFWVNYDVFDGNHTYLLSTSFESDRSAGVYFNTEMATGKYCVNYGDGTYFFNPSTRRTLLSNMIMTEGVWHHIAVVVSGPQDMKIYVDCKNYGGEYVGEGNELVYSDLPGLLGKGRRNTNEGEKYFKGSLDDFYYWDREISEEEIGFLCTEVPDMSTADTETEDFILSPNPVKDILTIHNLNSKIESVQIFNHSGQLVMNQNKAGNLINVSHLNPGTYLVKINTGKKVISKKFIKR